MSKKANPALIGAFVLVAIALGVAALVIFGGGKFFVQEQKAILYFDGSVKGLDRGSPVTFRGVKIGQVTDVKVVIDRKDMSIRTPVIIELEADRITDAAGGTIRFAKGTPKLKALVEQGFRAQMQVQSFVTGQLVVDFDFYPKTPIRMSGLPSDYPELPTMPSSMQQLMQTVQNLPLKELADGVVKTVESIRQFVENPELKAVVHDSVTLVKNADKQITRVGATMDETLRDGQKLVRNVDGRVGPLVSTVQEAVTRTDANLGAALADIRTLARNVDGRVGPITDDLEKALREAREVFLKAQAAVAGLDVLLEPGSPMAYNVNTALESVARAADSIRQLTNYLAQNPNAVVFGRGQTGGNTR